MEKKENTPSFITRSGMNASNEYVAWLSEVKNRFRQSQVKAAVRVNSAMLEFYWELGRDIVAMKAESQWGSNFFNQLSLDLRAEFPDMKGFSSTNLKYIKRWYQFYYEAAVNSHQVGDQLGLQMGKVLPMPEKFALLAWKHHVYIFTHSESFSEALFYINRSIEGNWSRRTLEDYIDSDLYTHQGSAITNFETTLSAPQKDLAQEILKDPYNFDFLSMKSQYDERELEDALIANITQFLLELGKGFAFVGRQMELKMNNGKSFYPDLVFYHTKLKSYIVIELKAVEFIPEFAGKINFYVSAADELLKEEDDNPSIGLIICKSRDKTIVEWAFRGIERPLGVATYQLQEVVNRTVAELEQKAKEKE